MIEIFKTKNNLNPTFMKNIFTEKNIPYSLRSENHLRLPKVKTTTHGIENIQYRGCHLWSSLPREIKDSNRWKYLHLQIVQSFYQRFRVFVGLFGTL